MVKKRWTTTMPIKRWTRCHMEPASPSLGLYWPVTGLGRLSYLQRTWLHLNCTTGACGPSSPRTVCKCASYQCECEHTHQKWHRPHGTWHLCRYTYIHVSMPTQIDRAPQDVVYMQMVWVWVWVCVGGWVCIKKSHNWPPTDIEVDATSITISGFDLPTQGLKSTRKYPWSPHLSRLAT